MNDVSVIHGYDYGTRRSARSPVMLDELRALEQTVGWTEVGIKTSSGGQAGTAAVGLETGRGC